MAAASLGALGLASLDAAHGRWQMAERRQLGSDHFEAYWRRPNLKKGRKASCSRGIVTAIGTIANVQQRGDLRLRIAAPLDPARDRHRRLDCMFAACA